MKIRRNSLTVNIWLYLILFSTVILAFLWVLQIGLLPTYYKITKNNDVKQLAKEVSKLAKSDGDYTEEIDSLSFNSGVCINIFSASKDIYTSTYVNKGCYRDKDGALNKLKISFIESGKNEYNYIIKNPEFKNDTLFYGIKIDDTSYAFLNTSLDPIESSVDIIQAQFVYVIIGIFLTSLIIAFFISNRISKPIIDINKSAKKLAKGDYRTYFTTSEDISELNELADTLNIARKELETTEELRRDLMANVSHDLKTPLTMIRAYAEMARDIQHSNPEKLKESMNVIIDETNRLNGLVNDMLDLSKLQANIVVNDVEEFELSRFIKNILTKYKIMEEQEGYKFIYENKKKIKVKADKQKIEQVLYNLINNAVKYTGKDKTIEIKTVEENGMVKVSVIDTGKGIDKSEQSLIWEKYYKSKKNHKRNEIGTGLGLNIVKNILEIYAYEYGVNSKKNKGTEFYFYLK